MSSSAGKLCAMPGSVRMLSEWFLGFTKSIWEKVNTVKETKSSSLQCNLSLLLFLPRQSRVGMLARLLCAGCCSLRV